MPFVYLADPDFAAIAVGQVSLADKGRTHGPGFLRYFPYQKFPFNFQSHQSSSFFRISSNKACMAMPAFPEGA